MAAAMARTANPRSAPSAPGASTNRRAGDAALSGAFVCYVLRTLLPSCLSACLYIYPPLSPPWSHHLPAPHALFGRLYHAPTTPFPIPQDCRAWRSLYSLFRFLLLLPLLSPSTMWSTTLAVAALGLGTSTLLHLAPIVTAWKLTPGQSPRPMPKPRTPPSQAPACRPQASATPSTFPR